MCLSLWGIFVKHKYDDSLSTRFAQNEADKVRVVKDYGQGN